MLNNILTTTVNPIPKDLAILNGLNANLTIENTKLKKLLYISVGIIVILTTITIIQKNEDRD
ncbi:MAG: hypothetical protein RL059_617 [Bacteroidota bacterium]|jgi:hypothetical protein